MPETRLTIRIDFAGKRQIGPGKIRLLELIDQQGSISSAARAMKMSYRRAWLLIDELNRMFDGPVVETQPGGKGGGHARLTDLGRQLAFYYRRIERKALADFAAETAALERRLVRDSGDA